MSYKLSYTFNEDTVTKYCEDEITLAHDIMNMERDVGKFCYGVKIEQTRLPEDHIRQDHEQMLREINRYSKILLDDLKRK